MNFTFSDEQIMVRDLARGILDKEVTPERLKKSEASADWFDPALSATLAGAGLLGLAVPADLGGMGFGFQELCTLLHEVGRAVAPVPVFSSLVLGGLAITAFGTDAQKKEWLPLLATGEVILTGALVDAASADPAAPATRACRRSGTWVLDGEKNFVPAAALARRMLVPATTDDGVGIFLVDPRAQGVALTPHRTSTGEPLFTVTLSNVPAGEPDLLGGNARGGGETAHWVHERALVALCATQIGVSEKALEITSGYVREREQFGVPIGSFQAVQHRAADGYIDLESMRWVTWRAAWKLSLGLLAAREVAVAKFWAADGGARIASTVQHLHGGIGVDLDYPIHRYFLWSKALELGLGGAMAHLAHLGRELARTRPQEL